MKRKSALIIAILIIAIGFAAISTTLIINGNARVSENTDDFSVIFTKAMLDDENIYANVISQDKKTITFETKDLKTLNDSSVLNYKVTNNSSNYDAEVTVNCKLRDNAEAKYTSIKNELENNATKVLAKETLNGTLTVTLNKTSAEEVTEEYVCTLEVNAVERDELGYAGPTEWTFAYTGEEQTFIVPTTGSYKLETWGAQGGSYSTYRGGFGAYSVGSIYLVKNTKVYINAGGTGTIGKMTSSAIVTSGGYNGGGANTSNQYGYGTTGGGATHIATSSGLLSSFEKNLNSLLIVSGGGGGGGQETGYIGYCYGGSAGGMSGSKGSSNPNRYYAPGNVGTQTSGYAFGQGENSSSWMGSGGSGLHGGYQGCGGGGASSYIGNSSLTEKAMYCYNCQESTEESTKTISTTCVSETPTENCAKSGNGYARITLIQ